MIRTLMRPRWLKALAGAFVFLLACIWLGQWQLGRYQHKQAKVHAIDHNYAAAPAPFRSLVPTPASRVGDDTLWRAVTVTGTYDGQQPLLVRNRPRDEKRGYEVVWPLRLSDGSLLLVDRGWLAARADTAASDLPTISKAPTGQVSVTGWLRWGEQDLDKPPAKGQLASINYTVAQQAIGGTVNSCYVVLRSEDSAAAGTQQAGARAIGLEAPPAPDRDEGWNNASYFGQWWLFGLVAIAMVVYGARREHLEELARERGDSPETPRKAPKPKKVRIWDEEDE